MRNGQYRVFGRFRHRYQHLLFFFEDVSGESFIFIIKRFEILLSTSQFVEDVSGETVMIEYSGDFTTDLKITIFRRMYAARASF